MWSSWYTYSVILNTIIIICFLYACQLLVSECLLISIWLHEESHNIWDSEKFMALSNKCITEYRMVVNNNNNINLAPIHHSPYDTFRFSWCNYNYIIYFSFSACRRQKYEFKKVLVKSWSYLASSACNNSSISGDFKYPRGGWSGSIKLWHLLYKNFIAGHYKAWNSKNRTGLTTAYGDKYHEKEFANVYLHSVRTRAANEDLDPGYITF